MMQELLNVVQRNYNSTSSSSINSSNSLSSPSSTSDQPPQQNLRCPRCDSPNTKFCYYNNYNLTQPRHFCKTCRRYWTKGGALRNVPIGGGCRKSRTATVMSASDKPKPKPRPMMSASDLVGLGSGSNLQLPPGLAPYSSHLLALLKASTQMQNPNSYRIKEEMISAPQQMQQNFWNSNMDQFERAGNYNVGFNSNASYYFPSFAAANTTAMSSSTAAAMEPVSTHSGDTMSWSDISASNGAYY